MVGMHLFQKCILLLYLCQLNFFKNGYDKSKIPSLEYP